ncbi:MAG: CHASE2 domain-containing protein [Rhodocyclaceae bacterium]|nr:CHASE2 domain-containing protein [Rhodocyclaceae bacterium]MDZ4215826.1 CHASE2 domain-containing protein [Rhodocyclaceae bacterium]
MKALLEKFQSLLLAHRGRPAALAVLLLLAATNWLSELQTPPPSVAPSTWTSAREVISSPFITGRRWLFDAYQQAFPRVRTIQPVAIVEIDEQSLKEIGQWPWPRNRLAQLINAINAHQPAVIGLDMYMPEVDQTSPARVARNLPGDQQALARALSALPSHEAALAQALRAAPTVLGAAGFDFETYTTSQTLTSAPMRVTSGDPLQHVRRYASVLASLPELQNAAQGQAVLSVGYDDAIVRRIPLVTAIGDQLVPSLPMELLRVASGADAIDVSASRYGVATVGVAELQVPTQANGEIWLHFARRATAEVREISAADVLAGKVPEDMLTRKVVMVGLTGSGLSDMRATPLRELVPGIEIQAQAVESLLEGQFLLRPFWLKPMEMSLLLGLGGIMIWLIPRRTGRIAHALTRSPKASSWLVMGLNAIFLALGFLLFHTAGLLFDAASLLIGFSAVLGSLISSAMLEIEAENLQLAQEQQQMREEAARISGELAAARRIQLGSLPNAQQLFAREHRFELDTMLEPAREVGGDLYDFFMIDAQRLCFVVGDVSGKGVPASLFMAVTRALAKSLALRLNVGPGAVVAAANDDLSQDNPELLFVTLILGVLNVETGQLDLVNAGHDAPWCLHRDGQRVRFTPDDESGGPPLCMLPGHAYTAQSAQLQPGDVLCLVTDGITEAMNAAGEIYGSQRLADLLQSLDTDQPIHDQTATLRADVARHVGPAEASDDMTLLLLRWRGPTEISAH